MFKQLLAFFLITHATLSYADSLRPPDLLSKQDRSIEDIKEGDAKSNMQSDQHRPRVTLPKHSHQQDIVDIKLRIGVNVSDGDLYLPLAGTLCIFMNESNSEACRIQKYTDHISTINGLLNGDVDFIITSSLLMQQVIDDQAPFEDKIMNKKLRFVASVFNEPLLILARRESQIKQLDDLKLASVNIPPATTKAGIMLKNIMDLKKWNLNSFKNYSELRSDEQIKAVCSNNIDVISFIGEGKSQYSKTATRLCEINIVNMSEDDLNMFKAKPQYAIETIEGGTYLGSPLDIETVASRVLIISTSDAKNTQVEYLLQTINKHIREMQHLHTSLKNITIPKILNEGRMTQIHDGVKDFVRKNKYQNSVNLDG